MSAQYHPRYAGRSRKKRSKFHRFVIFALAVLIIAAIGVGYLLYRVIYHPNVWLGGKEEMSVYIPSEADFEGVKQILYSHGIIINRRNFEWLAEKKKYPGNVKPGHYVIGEGMNNLQLINMLRAGKQVPVNVIFNNINTLEQLAGRVSQQIEADSADIIKLLNDSSFLSKYDLNPKTAGMLFLPNTYEFYWTTNAQEFIKRMSREYENFWTAQRKALADSIGLSPEEVVILASIVQKETSKNDEKPRIAAVYLNRLNSGWRLQADPTLIYAIGDYSIKRVLNIHKRVDSPYNTYKYAGLPPGPICIPSIASIEAVLEPDDNNYLFFCASPDMSGYHVFSKTHSQHIINARKYQKALDERKIYK